MHQPDLVIVWRVTEQCNLGCHFCGYSRHLSRSRRTADPRQVLAFGQVLGEYQVASGRTVLVSWLGGEPLIWKPLVEIANVFKNEFQLQLGVTTNGVPLSSAVMRAHVVAVYDQLTISIDGIGDFHDWCRDAAGLYTQLRTSIADLQTLITLSRSPVLLRVNTILMHGNIDKLEALCHELAAWGVRELTFNQLGGNDRPEFYPGNRLLPEQAAWLNRELPNIQERTRRLGLVVHGNPDYLERIACTARGIKISVADCGPGREFLFIDERGVVSPCSFTVEGYGIPLTEIKGLKDLQRLPSLFAERKRQQPLSPCLDCHSTRVFAKFR